MRNTTHTFLVTSPTKETLAGTPMPAGQSPKKTLVLPKVFKKCIKHQGKKKKKGIFIFSCFPIHSSPEKQCQRALAFGNSSFYLGAIKKITESRFLEWERTHKGHPVQPLALYRQPSKPWASLGVMSKHSWSSGSLGNVGAWAFLLQPLKALHQLCVLPPDPP